MKQPLFVRISLLTHGTVLINPSNVVAIEAGERCGLSETCVIQCNGGQRYIARGSEYSVQHALENPPPTEH